MMKTMYLMYYVSVSNLSFYSIIQFNKFVSVEY